ncbi:hypothetical protein BDM02DRAFT_3089975 [Thelephora ganbajun]|uniref:Uncharacterized protein n=1 Tax=Thelephora ganbajun TaxID=370292 RepID=A0ACB6ZQX4_THEGA|nr:hypothetical protein BDM02DRAFT_3089975 [Thelephora ganbajun]
MGPPKPGVMGNRVFGKVSQKSSLPVVEGSPVKGSGTPMDMDEAVVSDDEVEVTGGPMPPPPVPFKVFRDPQPEASTSKSPATGGAPFSPSTGDLGDIFFDPMDVEFDAKVHDEAWRRHASRRASYVMHNLSQSLSALPDSPPKRKEKRSMGPPPVPGTRTGLRSASSTVSTSPKDSQGKTTPGALDKGKQETNGSGGSGKKKAPVLKILKSCVVFVDVRTDEGDEAGGLFVEMLKGLGARTLSSVGQTCTHIVFKNGHTNTVKRYSLRELEHKPKVVGVAWVVECAEQRTKVDEEKFGVDLDMVHIPNFGTRRRRSMLPKPPKIQLGDFVDTGDSPGQASSSFESAIESETSTSDQTPAPSPADLSDLPPLERVRRRSMLARPHEFGSRA